MNKTEVRKKIAAVRARMKAEATPFDETDAASRAERIKKSKADALYFFKTYLPHYFSLPFADFHRDLAEYAELMEEPVFIAAPREHAKSTFFSLGVPVRDICLVLKRMIVVISDTEDLAADFTTFIKLELEENERIRADFGPMKGHDWADNDFTTRNGVRVKARGRGQRIRGIRNRQYRPDRVIIDDLENDKNVKNPKLVKETIDWLLTSVLGTLASGYTFTMIGTILAKNSVLSWFIAARDEETQEALYVSKIYRAYKDDGAPLWPDLWPPERLEKRKRQMGTLRFNQEMMNDPKDDEGVFREDWIKYYKPEEIAGKPLAVYEGIDPSVGANESSDYRAFVKVGRASDGTIYVLSADIKKRSVDSLVSTEYLRQKEQAALVIRLETVAFQAVLMILFNSEAEARGVHLPIQEVKHSVNKETRITSLSPFVERGVIRFRKNHSDQNLLVEQLIYFPSSTVNDDGPDALEMAVAAAQQYAGGPVKYETVMRRRFAGQKGAY